MKLHEYIETANRELNIMYSKWMKEHEKDPALWPLEMDEGEWNEQELAERFGIVD